MGAFSTLRKFFRFQAILAPVSLAALIVVPTANSHAKTPPTSRIANGSQAKVCALPPVANLDYGMCTGTLIHPRVLLYAAHCGKIRRFTLGESGKGPVVVKVQKSMTQPDFSPASVLGPKGSRIDWAFALLAERVQGLPVIPLAFAGELEQIMKPDQKVYMAGYGEDGTGSKFTALNWITGQISTVQDGMIVTQNSEQNACPGDSGGPLLVQLQDKTWRVAGIASTLGPDLDACGKSHGYNRYAQVRPQMVQWLEQETGLDLTPCYTPEGDIEVTKACQNFFAGKIDAPTGDWDDNCAQAAVVAEPSLVPKGGLPQPEDSPEDSPSADSEDSPSPDDSDENPSPEDDDPSPEDSPSSDEDTQESEDDPSFDPSDLGCRAHATSPSTWLVLPLALLSLLRVRNSTKRRAPARQALRVRNSTNRRAPARRALRV